MKYIFYLLLFSFTIKAQPTPVKINDTLWAIQTITINSNKGARTVSFSDFADSATIISQYQNVIENKFNILANRINEKEFQKMDSILQSITGESFDVMIKRKIEADIKGSWIVKDSLNAYPIVIDKSIVKDTTGKAIGTIEINSRESITINGVVKQPLVFRATNEGVIAVVNKNKYFLIKKV